MSPQEQNYVNEQLLDQEKGANGTLVKKNRGQNTIRIVAALVIFTLAVSIFTFIRSEQRRNDLRLSSHFDKIYVLHQFCDSFGQCFRVEQRYGRNETHIAGERAINFNDSNLALTIARLETPSVLTKDHLNPHNWKIDKKFMNGYNSIQAAAGFMSGSLSFNTSEPQKVLIIGLGGGETANFLSSMPVNLSIDAVELEPVIYNVAKRFFELTETERFSVYIEDGAKFVERAVNESTTYNSIILDACTNDSEPIMCPCEAFRTEETVENLSKAVGQEGILTVNVVVTTLYRAKRLAMIDLYKKYFRHCFSLHRDRQEVLFCSNRADWTDDVWNRNHSEFRKNLNDFDVRMRTKVNKLVNSYEVSYD